VLIDAHGRVVGMLVGSTDWDSPDAIELIRYYLRRRYAVPECLDPVETADQAEDDSAYDAYQRGDYAAAYREWLPLAEEGDAEAQYNLGNLYYLGQGVAQSKVTAATWYRRSAEQGFAEAQYNLAVMYTNGEGVPQNNILAYALFDLAAADDPEAAEHRDNVVERMTPDQIAEAQRVAREWLETLGKAE
jgi:TPR repeat protein